MNYSRISHMIIAYCRNIPIRPAQKSLEESQLNSSRDSKNSSEQIRLSIIKAQGVVYRVVQCRVK